MSASGAQGSHKKEEESNK